MEASLREHNELSVAGTHLRWQVFQGIVTLLQFCKAVWMFRRRLLNTSDLGKSTQWRVNQRQKERMKRRNNERKTYKYRKTASSQGTYPLLWTVQVLSFATKCDFTFHIENKPIKLEWTDKKGWGGGQDALHYKWFRSWKHHYCLESGKCMHPY